MQLPKGADPKTLKISWRLLIEEGRLEITCVLPDGRQSCWIHSSLPVKIAWSCIGKRRRVRSNSHCAAGPTRPMTNSAAVWRPSPTIWPLRNSTAIRRLRRWPRQKFGRSRASTLIEQAFFSDPLFAGGFRYWLVPLAAQSRIEAVAPRAEGSAAQITPEAGSRDGWLAVAVPTSSDAGNVEGECRRTRADLARDPAAAMARWREKTIAESRAFWSKSSVTIADPLMEALWYETFHLRRSIYRGDSVPPGLFLPSVMGDYSIWHGDYHTNFNLQAPFIGNYEANHLEIGDAFFRAMDFFLVMGRKTAHDYYNARGACISLSGFPIRDKDDPFGIGPFSRMAYMTGWTMQQYWLRYLYSGDKHWLREEGYPAIARLRACSTRISQETQRRFIPCVPFLPRRSDASRAIRPTTPISRRSCSIRRTAFGRRSTPAVSLGLDSPAAQPSGRSTGSHGPGRRTLFWISLRRLAPRIGEVVRRAQPSAMGWRPALSSASIRPRGCSGVVGRKVRCLVDRVIPADRSRPCRRLLRARSRLQG